MNTTQGIESAINAVSGMNNVTCGGVHYRVGLSMSLEKRLNEMMNQRMYGASNMMSQPPPMTNCYQPYVYCPPYGMAYPASLAAFYAKNQPQFVGSISPMSEQSQEEYVTDEECAESAEPMMTVSKEVYVVPIKSIDGPACGADKQFTQDVNNLQQQLDEARGDCASYKHSTTNVFMDTEEPVGCIDIVDY